jgi:hypothetical protein
MTLFAVTPYSLVWKQTFPLELYEAFWKIVDDGFSKTLISSNVFQNYHKSRTHLTLMQNYLRDVASGFQNT